MSVKDTGSWKTALESSEGSSVQKRKHNDTSSITSDDRFRKYGGPEGRKFLENKKKCEMSSRCWRR